MGAIRLFGLGLLLASIASCTGTGSKPNEYGGQPVAVEIRVVAPAGPGPETGAFALRGWVLNPPGLVQLGGRDRLTAFANLLERDGADSKAVEDAREELVVELNRLALHRLSSSTQTVELEPKPHTVVVEHGTELRHIAVNVVKLTKPFGVDFQL